jgi:hypothetical protein
MTDQRDPRVRETVTRLALSSPSAPTFDELTRDPVTPVVRRAPAWAIALGAAATVLIVIGGASFLFGGSDGSAEEAPVAQATTVAPASTTVPEAVVAAEGWHPILSETVAGVTPQAATCPPGATPHLAGAADQVRPGEGPWSNQAAVFDAHAGRIVFVDETAETWTFDVCTNTWERMAPDSTPSSREIGELVYDVDSDRTIAFGPVGLSIYDANTNLWFDRLGPKDIDMSFGVPGIGAVYDPVSGLVLVVTDKGLLMAYDVDTDTWTEVGMITQPREISSEGQIQSAFPSYLVGYVAETDRLAFLPFDGAPFQDESRLLNPRTGQSTPLKEPPGGVRGGFGSLTYATGGETAYPYGNGVCRLDPASLDWNCNPYVGTFGPSAMVFDAINDRIVVINNFCCNWPGSIVTDGIQAIDFNSGEQIELLATANTRTESDGS